MKINWIKGLCLLMAVAIICCCVGCAGNVPDPADGTTSPSHGADQTDPSAGNPPSVPKPTVNQYQDPNATHFYEEVRENFLIDAAVVGAPDIAPRGIYQGELMLLSQAQIDAFLAANGDSAVTRKETTSEHYYTYNATCTSGSKVYYSETLSRKDSVHFQYQNGDKYDPYSNYWVYWGEYCIEEKGSLSTAWMFREEKELPFASADQAEQEVRQKLAFLGLTELTLNRTLYIDHATMAEAGKWLNENVATSSSLKGEYSFLQKEDWSDADDAYMFSFSVDIRGVPLSRGFSTEVESITPYQGCEVIVFCTADGIVYLDYGSPWNVGEPVGEKASLISAGEALEATRATLMHVLSYKNLVIDKVSLEYQYRQDGDRWLLFPVWVVRAYYEMAWTEGYNYLYYRYDAMTGEEI